MEKERDALLSDCLNYFRERPVYRKVFEGFQKRYESLGHFGGKIQLCNPSPEEKDQLSGFFRKDFSENKTITISWKMMEQALQNSRFACVDAQELFEAYLGKPLCIRKEEKNKREEEKERWLRLFLQKETEGILDAGAPVRDWLLEMFLQKGADYQYITGFYQAEPAEAKKLMEAVCRAGKLLPFQTDETEELAVFAARVTANPHFFDMGSRGLRVLVFFLRYLFAEGLSCTDWELLEKAGILRDALSNHILVYQLHARKEEGGLHEGLEGFYKEKQPCLLTLKTIQTLSEIWGEGGSIYMVENPAVFSYLVQKYPKESFLCGNGQLKTAAYRLLERLLADISVYYAGDFDPEGLLIAQRLCDRFPKRVHLWHYEKRLYQMGLSEEKISDWRMKKLKGLTEPGLAAIAEQMQETGRAAYQEAVMEAYVVGAGQTTPER